MPKPSHIEMPGVEPIPILYEDRAVLAIDKPRGWMLVPFSWQKTKRNLQVALTSSIAAGDFWARSRGLRFLRFVNRLDADTTGILLFVKSRTGLQAYSDLFESRRMEKTYLAVVHGQPQPRKWICRLKLAPDPRHVERMRVDRRSGKETETSFRVLATNQRSAAVHAAARAPQHSRSRLERHTPTEYAAARAAAPRSLVEAHPVTGRKHQIRVHLAEAGHPVVGDELYGRADDQAELGLRAVRLAYVDPFTRRRVEINAPTGEFCHKYGFD